MGSLLAPQCWTEPGRRETRGSHREGHTCRVYSAEDARRLCERCLVYISRCPPEWLLSLELSTSLELDLPLHAGRFLTPLTRRLEDSNCTASLSSREYMDSTFVFCRSIVGAYGVPMQRVPPIERCPFRWCLVWMTRWCIFVGHYDLSEMRLPSGLPLVASGIQWS